MTKPKRSSSIEIDPFDVEWMEEDPLGRDVVMSKSIIAAREAAGKHPFPPEHLATEDVRIVVSTPDFIEESSQSAFRDVYYKVSETEENPFARVVVDFKNSDNKGIVVSWSRYKHTAATYGRKWSSE